MKNALPSQEYLNSIFKVENGTLINNVARGSQSKHGVLAGWIDKTGYQKVRLNGVKYMAHRLVWKMVYNAEPEFVDHIDGNRLNNCVENLRSVNHSENMKNKAKQRNNSSGVTGVVWYKKLNKWAVNIKIDGKLKHLGYFEDFNQAVQIRTKQQEKLGFSFRHGV